MYSTLMQGQKIRLQFLICNKSALPSKDGVFFFSVFTMWLVGNL